MPKGELEPGEIHPAAQAAFIFIRKASYTEMIKWRETFATCALAGNRLAGVCHETLRRLMEGETVSDRYLLGLAWTIKEEMEKK